MRHPFLKSRIFRLSRLVSLLVLCAVIILSATMVRNFSILQRRSVDGFYQDDVDHFAKHIEVHIRVLENAPKVPSDLLDTSVKLFSAEISLTNRGDRMFPAQGWSIFFNQILTIEPACFPDKKVCEKPDQHVRFRHWNGQLYSLEPMETFQGIGAQETKIVRYYSYCCSVTFTDFYPNWYIVFRGLEPRTLSNTADEPDHFVAAHDSVRTWKRIPDKNDEHFDQYNPPRVQDRFKRRVNNLGHAPIPVIPTPVNVSNYRPNNQMNVFKETWFLVAHPKFQTAVAALREKWNLQETENIPSDQFLQIIEEEVKVQALDKVLPLNETYQLVVDPTTKTVTVRASHPAGAFYAVQSLLALLDSEGNLPQVEIFDGPRFPYRGLMIDVARNFLPKESIKRYIDVMAMYKLNKFHFHLTDDEGWRLEIPGLPELTQVGGRRCHDPAETTCLLPFLGSGPYLQSGFYTMDDYKDILQYAVARHVEVIPEVDMPGHSHAAAKAMLARFIDRSQADPIEAARFLLTELQDKSKYASVQNFVDGVVNPCLQSTYAFIRLVVGAIVDLHQDISPLRTFHLGGDEVPQESWLDSQICRDFTNSSRLKIPLKQFFVLSFSQILAAFNLEPAAWEDGLMSGDTPVPRASFSQEHVHVYAWNNVWEYHNAKRAYDFANAGYKVILTPATNLYLDHPYDADPDERGLIWATRYTNTWKIFQLMPKHIYLAERQQMSGQPIPDCSDDSPNGTCPRLTARSNIEGIQGTLFGEQARSEKIVDYLVFPRLLALAERAWHTAPWEQVTDREDQESQMTKDWQDFANTLGHQELARLDDRGILYRVPPPGAAVDFSGTMKASVEFPGLEVQMSTDGGHSWQVVPDQGVAVKRKSHVQLRTRSARGDRYSRVVQLQ